MTQQAFKLNTRLATGDKEYLIQTVNDDHGRRVLTSLFSNGELLETFEETFDAGIKNDDLKKLVNSTHEDKKRELEQLIDLYQKSSEITDPGNLHYLGQALYYKRMYHESIKLLERAVELDPEFHEGFLSLGVVQFSLNKFKDACQSFSRAVELRPGYADYRNHLGESFLALDSCKRAVIEFDEALKLNIYYGEAYLNQAMAYILNAIRREDFNLFTNQEEMTGKALEKASVIMPDIVDQDFLEGQKFFEQGNLEKAFAKFLTCREKRRQKKDAESSSFYLKFMLGTGRLNEKMITRRIKSLQNALSNNPHYPDLHYELAVAFTLLGRYIHEKAVEEYKKALSVNPDFERAQKNLKLAENELKGTEVIIKAILKG
ncbi:MAG TPA: tetratricopeptide repeat protein [candidate division Zixibacteria bacterium]|nr:tetratricopeptide repeat protein [candidate division Zixibacteria bacterium]